MQFSQALPDHSNHGAIYLRWQTQAAAGTDLQGKLRCSLRETQEEARQAGVELAFSATGTQWLLKLTGLQEPMPSVLEHALKCLTQIDADSASAEAETPLIPIRQLLKALPEYCLSSAVESNDARQLWTTSRWDGLALGLNAQTQSAMGLALSRIPGTPDNQLPAATAINPQHLWSHIDIASSEHALLLFCPSASREIADEAAWRLLAQLCQTPFYQRLRVELQLGYAVFSALRQMHGQSGLLFGVQSPDTAPVELLGHIQQFLEGIPALIENLDEGRFNEQRQSLADQFGERHLSDKDASELLWQAKLAGHSSDYLAQLHTAINQLERSALLAAAQRLLNAEGGWRCLANESSPGAPWQATK